MSDQIDQLHKTTKFLDIYQQIIERRLERLPEDDDGVLGELIENINYEFGKAIDELGTKAMKLEDELPSYNVDMMNQHCTYGR